MIIQSLAVRFLLTFLVAGLGGVLAKKLRLPAGLMTGAMLFVLFFNIVFCQAYVPSALRPILQGIAGGAIGVSIDRSTISGLKKLFFPVLTYVLALVVVAVVAAVIIILSTPLLPTTAILSTAPGGILDMSLLSYEFGANTTQVSLLQMMRIIFALGLFPSLTSAYLRRAGQCSAAPGPVQAAREAEAPGDSAPAASFAGNLLLTLLVIAIGATIGYFSGLPAGTLSCSVIAVGFLQVKTGRAVMPTRLRQCMQIVAGAMIGTTMIPDLVSLSHLLLPLVIVLVEYLALNYLIGPFIARIFHLGISTMLLACTPAGVSDLALIADDLGGVQAQVAVFQVSRLTSVLILFPFIVQLFAMFQK